jgi:hypothetical protein
VTSVDEQIEASERPERRRLLAVLRFAFGLALFILVLRWLAPNGSELLDRVELHPAWVLVGLLGTTLASIVTAARWQLLAEVMGGTRLPFIAYFYGLVLTRLLGQFTSTMAMDLVGRGVALRSAGSERSIGHAVMQVVLERMLDAVLPVVLFGWAWAVREQLLPIPSLASLALAYAGFLLLAIPLLRPSVHVALRVYLWVRLRVRGRRREQLEAEAEFETPKVDLQLAAKVAGYSVLRFATVVLQFFGIACAVGLALDYVEMTKATPIPQIAGMLGLTPGGLGILEAGWAGGLGWIGLDAVAIGLFALAQRVGVIAFFAILSALSWPLAKRARA